MVKRRDAAGEFVFADCEAGDAVDVVEEGGEEVEGWRKVTGLDAHDGKVGGWEAVEALGLEEGLGSGEEAWEEAGLRGRDGLDVLFHCGFACRYQWHIRSHLAL